MITYVKKSSNNKYLEFQNPLDPTLYNTGRTYEDYVNGKYVKLSEDQLLFKEEHPEATVENVIRMYILDEVPVEKTTEEHRQAKLREIEDYDNSGNVNGFFYGSSHFWLDKATRVGLMNSTSILYSNGELNTTLWLDDLCVTIPCEQMLRMLGQLEMYALQCYNITAEHKNQVMQLDNTEDIINFDVTADYPDKLRF